MFGHELAVHTPSLLLLAYVVLLFVVLFLLPPLYVSIAFVFVSGFHSSDVEQKMEGEKKEKGR